VHVVLVALWSPKGGSGTSVLAAAASIVVARGPAGVVRLADLDGDQPAIFGLGAEPAIGLVDWLDAGPEAPTEALDRLAVEVAPGLALLPRGGSERVLAPVAAAEAGAALAVVLGDGPVPTLVDCGRATEPATRALVEVADVSVVVLRGCYLTLRRALRAPALARTTGVVLVEEKDRSLSEKEVTDVLDLPLLARVPYRTGTFRAVDAGVLATRLPESLGRAAGAFVQRVGLGPARRGAAA
jgi:MinD-like ATPase involved in chromosome partitioning or flagellar assembly